MTRTLAAVLLAAIVGVAPAAVPVAGDEPPLFIPACETVLSPAPGFTELQWRMLWGLAPGLAPCVDFSRIPIDHHFDYPGPPPPCNLFEYLEGTEVAVLLYCD